MPRRIALGISSHSELTIMVTLGMVRNVMNWFSFTWTGNVQKIWDLPGPEASFTAKYHFNYWLKNVLSLVVLFRNFTTHLHFVLYIVMLYPLLTGERPRLMVPWLYLQLLKNVVTDVICTVVGVLLCWTLRACGSMLLEFLVVRVISMMPSIYLWRRLQSYYYDLYYAELDADYSYPTVKSDPLTLAQRRRAAKSLDGAFMSSGNRSRIISCATYEEIFGPPNWEEGVENVTKSLTTLLTMESEGSDDVEEESCLEIIDGEGLTLAEKTLRVLGMTRDDVDGANKKTSTTEVTGHETDDVDSRSSLFSVAEEAPGPRTVGMQVRIAEASGGRRTRCACCEETKCFKEEESDSEEEDEANRAAYVSSKINPVDCCDKTRDKKVKLEELQHSDDKKRDPEAQVTLLQCEHDSGTVSPPSGYRKDHCYSGSRLQAVLERDDIAWENLKEINFVSVINKALSNEVKPFKLQRDWEDEQRLISHQIPESLSEQEIIPEREDGTKFISRPQTSWDLDGVAFSVPTSASFGVDSNILALNASCDFEKSPISGTQSSDSTVLIRPDHDISDQSHFKSSFQRHSNMFDGSGAQLEPLGSLQREVDSSTYRGAEKIPVNYDPWDFGAGKFSVNPVRDVPDSGKSEDALELSRESEVTLKSLRIMSGEKNLTKDRRSLASSSRSSRSSRTRETAEEREAKAMQALKAYNEKTLLKYKREMEEFRYPLSKRNRATSFCQNSYASLAPGFETPEEELILHIENAYARFTRSKPPNSNLEAVTENSSTKEFFEIYSGDVAGRGKKYCKNKLNEDKKGMRKQHSKYSESVGGVKRNESDATSMSCKIIEGSQKGRELGRTVAMENITAEHNVQQVYFLDQPINDRPSTSKNLPITTIKSFPGQLNGANVLGTVSSEVLTPMVEVLNNTEEIPVRIEDTEYYRQLRKNTSPKNVKDAVRNIDWSFRRPTHVDVHSHKVCNTGAEVVRAETNPAQDIVEKTTEKILEIAFANSENSDRGFRLGESDSEFYPIFNTFSVAIEEIVRAVGRRGHTDEFISQPATEVEITEADVYGLTCCESTRRSSLRCDLTEDIQASKKRPQEDETTSTTTGSPGEKPEAPAVRREDSLDRDETVSIHANEEGTSVLRKLIASEESVSAEISVPVIGPEDVPERAEKVQRPKLRDLDNHPCRRILNRFDAGGTELQGMIAKVFDRFDPSGEILFPNGSLRGSDFIAGLQIVSNLLEIRNKAGEIISAAEETTSKDTGNSTLEENSQSESRSTSGTPAATNFENTSANTSTGRGFGREKGDRDNEENNFTRRLKSDLDGSGKRSSSDKIGEPKKLLSSISNADSVSPTRSEVLRRENFRREVITSAFVQAVQQGSAAGEKDTQVQDESLGADPEVPEDQMPELWVTDNEQQTFRSMIDFASNATPDIVLREIEMADHAIKRMKTIFERFSEEQEKNRTDSLKIDSKVSFLTNLRFPDDGELRKLKNLVRTVANYAMIFGSTSAQSMELDRRESSGIFQKVPQTLEKNQVDSIPNDCSAVADTLPKSRSVLKNPESQGPARSRDNMERFSSWDKIIPLSTRRQLAKNRRKSKPKKPVADREPPIRAVKLAKPAAKKELDFFGARSIPQRGKGLSSGYLMDSDSDGNFTVSRPSTPASIESTTSQNLSLTIEEPKSDSPVSQAPHRSIEPCWNSSSENNIQGVKGDDQSTQNAPRGEDLDVIGTMSVDAAGIENNLKDVVRLILSHRSRGLGTQTVSKNTSLTTISVPTRTDRVDVEQNCEIRVRAMLPEAEENPVEQLVAHCRDSASKSKSLDVAQRKSKGSLKDVGIGTECDTEVLDKLLDMFGEIHSKGNEIIPEKNYQNEEAPVTNVNSSSNLERYHYEPKEEVEVPNRFTMTSSYDSFISLFSQNNFVDLTDQSRQVTTISNHSRFEEFPEQVVSSLQSLGTTCSVADAASRESSKTDDRLQEEDLEEDFGEESSFTNSVTSTTGSSKADANSERNPSSKKKGIPRLIRETKGQKKE